MKRAKAAMVLSHYPWRDRGSSLLFDSVERRVREFWANDGPDYQAEIILQLSSKDDFWLGKSAFPEHCRALDSTPVGKHSPGSSEV